MKKITLFLFLAAVLELNWNCGNTSGVSTAKNATSAGTIFKGTIANAANMQMYLDKIYLTSASQIISKADLDASGNFSVDVADGVEPGVYRFRIGQQKFLSLIHI